MTNFVKTKRCVWLLSGVTEQPVRRCGAAVRYTMVKDDDNRSVRKYASFCDVHQKLSDEQDAAEEANDGGICICQPTCKKPCKGECGCVKCCNDYADFLSGE